MNDDPIPFVDLVAQHGSIREELLAAVDRVLSHGGFILGEEVAAFEREFADYCGTRYAVGVANGTDALVLALRGIGVGEGDEVITAPNSFLASASSIVLAGARPVFVDVRDDFNIDPERIESAITPRTRAIVPVHLTGRIADMDPILEIAARRGLSVIEDAAQAAGASHRGRRAGGFGFAGCFSFHPLKTLGACGDGGMVVTNDRRLYEFLLKARNHGLRDPSHCDFWSINSRLDAIHAATLRVKMRHLEGWNEGRRCHAAAYRESFDRLLGVPQEASHERSVYHTFIVRSHERDRLQQHLARRGIDTRVHYNTPIHLLDAARHLGYRPGDFPVAERLAGEILSLPVYAELALDRRARIIAAVREFCMENS